MRNLENARKKYTPKKRKKELRRHYQNSPSSAINPPVPAVRPARPEVLEEDVEHFPGWDEADGGGDDATSERLGAQRAEPHEGPVLEDHVEYFSPRTEGRAGRGDPTSERLGAQRAEPHEGPVLE